jgi:hypothetical protein
MHEQFFNDKTQTPLNVNSSILYIAPIDICFMWCTQANFVKERDSRRREKLMGAFETKKMILN